MDEEVENLRERIAELENRARDYEWLFKAYYVLASDAGLRPGSRELIAAASRFSPGEAEKE